MRIATSWPWQVEHHLAKVDVASSNLVSRSNFPPFLARWQSGYATDCNSVYVGSIPARASIITALNHRPNASFLRC